MLLHYSELIACLKTVICVSYPSTILSTFNFDVDAKSLSIHMQLHWLLLLVPSREYDQYNL